MLLWLQFQSHCLLLSDWGRTHSPWRWSHSLFLPCRYLPAHWGPASCWDLQGRSLFIIVADGVGSPRPRRGGSFLPRPKSGLLFNTQKLIFRADTHAGKGRDIIGKGFPEERAGELLCPVAHSLWCYGDWVDSQPRPIVLTQGPSWWVCASLPGWISARRILGDWLDRWTGVFSLLLTVLEFFQLVVAC